MTRHLLKLQDFDPLEARRILTDTARFKAERGRHSKLPLQGQTWGLLFSKPSTRTRVSFEVAIGELGGTSLFLSSHDVQLGRGEPVRDTARVMGRMLHGTVFRTYAQGDVEEFATLSKIPTVNALTDEEHPCQILTDIFTFEEKRGPIRGKRVAFIGDASCNVPRSWVYAAELFDFELVCAAPAAFQTPVKNDHTTTTADPLEAARGAHLLYTDVWVSMGKEEEAEQRLKVFNGYQINHELLSVAHADALVLHCLPAYRGKEITEAVLEERATDIFDQAENRLHTQKSILNWVTGG